MWIAPFVYFKGSTPRKCVFHLCLRFGKVREGWWRPGDSVCLLPYDSVVYGKEALLLPILQQGINYSICPANSWGKQHPPSQSPKKSRKRNKEKLLRQKQTTREINFTHILHSYKKTKTKNLYIPIFNLPEAGKNRMCCSRNTLYKFLKCSANHIVYNCTLGVCLPIYVLAPFYA